MRKVSVSVGILFLVFGAISLPSFLVQGALTGLRKDTPAVMSVMVAIATLIFLFKEVPWTIVFDFDRRTYEVSVGFLPFVLRRSGSFADIAGVLAASNLKTERKQGLIVAVRLKKPWLKRTFWLESEMTPDQATRRARAISLALDVDIIDERGKPITARRPPEDEKEIVAYTQSETSGGRYTTKNVFVPAIIYSIVTVLVWIIPLMSTPSKFEHDLRSAAHLSFMCSCFSIGLFVYSDRWRIELNYAKSRFKLVRGFGPFVKVSEGEFDQILAVGFEQLGKRSATDPYAITIAFRGKSEAKKYWIEPAYTVAEAQYRVEQLAARLGAPMRVIGGKKSSIEEESKAASDFAVYDQLCTLAGARRAGAGVTTCLWSLAGIIVNTGLSLILWKYIPLLWKKVLLQTCVIDISLFSLFILGSIDAMRWKIKFDFSTRKFESAVGFAPFFLNRAGSFDKILNVGVISRGGSANTEPYLIAVNFKNPFGKRQFYVDSAYTGSEAQDRAAQLAERLDTQVVTSGS